VLPASCGRHAPVADAPTGRHFAPRQSGRGGDAADVGLPGRLFGSQRRMHIGLFEQFLGFGRLQPARHRQSRQRAEQLQHGGLQGLRRVGRRAWGTHAPSLLCLLHIRRHAACPERQSWRLRASGGFFAK
jgi:hypothetical protein